MNDQKHQGPGVLCLVVALASSITPTLAAQEPAPQSRWTWTRPVVRYGKWLTAAAAAGLTVLAAREHNRSAKAWDQLLGICRADNQDCAIGADGAYLNPVSEAAYQQSLHYDARARHRLMAGQFAVVVSAALFIADLRRKQNGPPNIPFDPNKLLVAPAAGGGTKIGLRLSY
jgi:hypothetical protein